MASQEKMRYLLFHRIRDTTGQSEYPYFIANLPPVTLHLLLNIQKLRLSGSSLASLRTEWEAALEKLTSKGGESRISPVNGALIFTHHILGSTAKPISTIRLAKSIFSNWWRNYEQKQEVIDALGAALPILRSPWSDTKARILAIESLSRLLASAPYWQLVENALYHQIFAWPLLVFRDGGTAISLPVGIDVYFDAASKVDSTEDGSIDTSEWRNSLRDAVEAAKVLWRGKHGNFGEFRDEVSNASVTFDFGIADRIVKDFPERVTLKESSMESYFSQVVLSRLLGNVVSTSSIVTGSIGNRRWDEPGGYADFEFLWPWRVADKLRCVFSTRFFERVILPHLDDLAPEDPRRDELRKCLRECREEQSTELNFVKHLQHVADSFQTGGWRQFRYVRCPDIAWRTHPSGMRLPGFETKGVQIWLSALRECTSSVLDAPGDMNPIDLAGALWHINMNLRNQILLQVGRPPMMSWAFIRAIPEEQDSRFWHVVWRLAGALDKDFDNFYRCATSAGAAQFLAEALNCFSPTLSCPSHRAPDILVLIGTDHGPVPISVEKGMAYSPESH